MLYLCNINSQSSKIYLSTKQRLKNKGYYYNTLLITSSGIIMTYITQHLIFILYKMLHNKEHILKPNINLSQFFFAFIERLNIFYQ